MESSSYCHLVPAIALCYGYSGNIKRNQRQNSVTLKWELSADLKCYSVERKLIWSFTLVAGSSVTYFHPVQCQYFGLSLANYSGVTAAFVNLFHHETIYIGALR